MHMKFEGAAATCSSEEIKDKLESAESNYVLRGQPASLDTLTGIIARHRLDFNCDPKFVKGRILALKKVDKF